ncbi:hypothetical protein [Petrachloros mirabilis]
MYLDDERYEGENGRQIPRGQIDFVGTYRHKMDGFFEWECGNHECRKSHASRAYKIMGTVWTCSECHKKTLLLPTDIRRITQTIRAANNRETSAEIAISKALKHLAQGIAALKER